ncbi:MAG: hypothetical protein A2571_00770 [Candidatus Vogelbacteria bacterium RIFOXYD1_FULL_44_32]|uniref:Uncharacterized protein n=1 Tax=Candidatus Vogelbacteria bacterium RIFOXYD1_FULL_44_32 TaxID=1802438 RepID=A0A1G2QE81_9BACT|nr:MAG: hypothetical protein A2571_00770 [Candidatus Vogelbacteria bacterium RIFOXYD1_FULL_44_32]
MNEDPILGNTNAEELLDDPIVDDLVVDDLIVGEEVMVPSGIVDEEDEEKLDDDEEYVADIEGLEDEFEA